MKLPRFVASASAAFGILLLASASGCDRSTAGETPEGGTEVASGPGKSARVRVTTDYGTLVIELSDATPAHRDNFLKLVEEGFYDSLLFHRVINRFMIQGGDPASKNAAPGTMLGSGGPGYTVPAEFRPELVHIKGAVCAARQGDQVNPTRASSGSQFYIVQGRPITPDELGGMQERYNLGKPEGEKFAYTPDQISAYGTLGGTPFLDLQYTCFGRVVEGLEVIDSIAAVRTAPGDRPVQDVRMQLDVIR